MRKIAALLLSTLVGLSVADAQEARVYTTDGVTFAPSVARFELAIDGTDPEEDDSERAEITYRVNDGDQQTYEAPLHFPEEGRYRITYSAVNSAGVRSREETYEIVIDDTAPAVTATARGTAMVEGDTTYLRTDTELILRGSDSAAGLATIFVSLDNENFVEYSGAVSFPGEGRYRGYAYAVDNVGNRSPTVTLSAVVDDIPPSVRVIPRRPTATVRGARYATTGTPIAIRAEDGGSGVSRVEVSVDRAEFKRVSQPITLDEPGERSLRARAVDRAGNESQMVDLSFIVDETLPQPSVETLVD